VPEPTQVGRQERPVGAGRRTAVLAELSTIAQFGAGQGKKAGVILHIPSFTAGLSLFLRIVLFMSILGHWLP